MNDLDDLARRLRTIKADLTAQIRTTRLTNASLEGPQGDGGVDLVDVVDTIGEVADALPPVQAVLDAVQPQIKAAADAVAAATEAAEQAGRDGIAAGELASEAADQALQKAQEALDAAAQAGGGAVYTGRAPTADDKGKPGAQWFVWDSNYHVTAYYVYQDDTVKWVQTVVDDGVFGNLSAARLTSGYIDAARIAAGSLTAAVLAADTLTSREIGADAILARNIKAAVITGDKLVANTITAREIKAGTITANEIAANTITSANIVAGSITATELNLNTLNGKTITGAILQSAASGQRVVIDTTFLSFYDDVTSGTAVGKLSGRSGSLRYENPARSSTGYMTLDVDSINLRPGSGQVSLAPSGLALLHSSGTYSASMTPNLDGFTHQTGATTAAQTRAIFGIGGGSGASAYTSLRNVSYQNNTPSTNGAVNVGYQDTSGVSSKGSWDLSASDVDFTTARIAQVRVTNSVRYPDGTTQTTAPAVPAASASGTGSYTGTITNGSSVSVTVTFPSGRFSSAPVLTASATNARLTVGVSSVSATGATLSLANWSTGSASGTQTVQWIARMPD